VEVNAYETKGVKEVEILIYTRNTLSKKKDYQLIYIRDCLKEIRELVPLIKSGSEIDEFIVGELQISYIRGREWIGVGSQWVALHLSRNLFLAALEEYLDMTSPHGELGTKSKIDHNRQGTRCIRKLR